MASEARVTDAHGIDTHAVQTHVADGPASDEHGHGHHVPGLHHHFDDLEQQREATGLGMWSFLATEVMMFGGLFFAYCLYRWKFHDAYLIGSGHLNITLGTINTFVLLFSSLTMAMAVHSAQERKRKPLVMWLVATMILGAAFLGVKAVEWTADYHEGLIPSVSWNPAKWPQHGGAAGGHEATSTGGHEATGASTASANGSTASAIATQPLDENVASGHAGGGQPAGQRTGGSEKALLNQVMLYFILYFSMTGLHAIHMIIGLGIVGVMARMAAQGKFTNGNDQPVELVGLYWHFVDIVWVFLFPLLYLIGGFHPFGGGH